jgi:hypothetical protein
MDLRSLTTHVETKSSEEPQPKDHPLGFLAFRARRYFLVLAGLVWVTLIVTWLLEPTETDWLASRGMFLLFGVLFGVSRRPMNKTIFQLVQRGAEEAEDALDSFLEGRAVHTQRDRREQRR